MNARKLKNLLFEKLSTFDFEEKIDGKLFVEFVERFMLDIFLIKLTNFENWINR